MTKQDAEVGSSRCGRGRVRSGECAHGRTTKPALEDGPEVHMGIYWATTLQKDALFQN